MNVSGKKIEKISGPASMYLIKPYKNNTIYLPSLLLFGDIHFSRENACEESKDTDIMSISDPSFYKTFEPYASVDSPVDVYIETFEVRGSYESFIRSFAGGFLEDLLSNQGITSCFRRKPEREEKCSVPKLRWHLADARFAERWLEKEDIIDYYYYEALLDPLKFYYVKLLKIYNTEYYESIMKILLSIYRGPDDIISTFFEEIGKNPSKSIIMKQIRKAQKGLDKNKIKDMFRDLLDRNHYNTFRKYFKLSSEEYKDFLESKETMEYYPPEKYDLENMEMIYQRLCHTVMNVFIEMYTILRILKKPRNGHGLPPVLAICYMGNKHITNINYIMNKYFPYKEVYSKEEKNKERCIDITQEINMDEIIEESRKSLDKYFPLLN